MFSGIAETGARLKDDSSVRAVVLSGRGRAFCAGLDLGQLAADPGTQRDNLITWLRDRPEAG